MLHVAEEIASQPDCWAQAQRLSQREAVMLPGRGERVAVVGCGTSLFVGRAYAVLREAAGAGLTDAFPASEFPLGRDYDKVVTISRSGTTTEVLDVPDMLGDRVPTVAITADPASPVLDHAGHSVVLDFADERSVVQTRFATSTLALLRAHPGHDLGPVIAAAGEAVDAALPEGAPGREPVHLPRARLDRRPGARGRTQDARGRAGPVGVLPGDGVSPRTHEHQR
ncbi:SIS domain-containing protein [Nocardioides sp. B-3]|uniref:SIS domain-containing protein n=1 Tax=Nocardioides sp. B-3 TaxID=2895565 RepID=UPI002152B553|nr:SIS domain-containing protein [Nocardioides sp. B-3]UUZ58627.1 SIS domain-containing protein [Nocardioides sp. B-3]